MKKKLFKCFGSVALLAYLFHQVGWEEVWVEIQEISPSYLLIYIALGFLSIFVRTLKWFHLNLPFGNGIPFMRLYAMNIIGLFFNHILPTSMGGDVVRAIQLGKLTGKNEEAFATVFLDRFTGVVMLILLSLIGVTLDQRYLGEKTVVFAISIAALGILVVLFFLYKGVPFKKLMKFQEAIHFYRNYKMVIFVAMLYAFLFNVVSVINVYVGCLMFQWEVSLVGLLTAVPLMLLLFMIPISIGGIGLQEWAYYFVLSSIGVPAAVGFSLGLIYRARSVGMGLIGGFLYPFLFLDKQRERI